MTTAGAGLSYGIPYKHRRPQWYRRHQHRHSASGDLTVLIQIRVAANAIGSGEITDATIGAIDMAPG
ncbi:MAG: hypothetical protein IPH36_12745 [Saprospiraceae bacterium]|nr:hypothetical protein [Saprospiraceae bacterium]